MFYLICLIICSAIGATIANYNWDKKDKYQWSFLFWIIAFIWCMLWFPIIYLFSSLIFPNIWIALIVYGLIIYSWINM